VEEKGRLLEQLIVDADRRPAGGAQAGRLAALLDLRLLKFQDRDELVDAFKNNRPGAASLRGHGGHALPGVDEASSATRPLQQHCGGSCAPLDWAKGPWRAAARSGSEALHRRRRGPQVAYDMVKAWDCWWPAAAGTASASTSSAT
jgi:hypothetical protein